MDSLGDVVAGRSERLNLIIGGLENLKLYIL